MGAQHQPALMSLRMVTAEVLKWAASSLTLTRPALRTC